MQVLDRKIVRVDTALEVLVTSSWVWVYPRFKKVSDKRGKKIIRIEKNKWREQLKKNNGNQVKTASQFFLELV